MNFASKNAIVINVSSKTAINADLEVNADKPWLFMRMSAQFQGNLYIGKTQLYKKKQTGQHILEVWKIIKTGRSKYGENWTIFFDE